MTDDALRAALAAVRDEATTPHPTDEALFAAASGEATPDEVAAIAAHAVSCGRCAESWRLAVSLQAPLHEAPATPIPANQPRWFGRALIAVAAAAVVGAIGLSLRPDPAPVPEWRAGAPQVGITFASAADWVPREEATLAWAPIEGASAYVVEVSTAELAPVYRIEVREPTARIPVEALASWPDGTGLLWHVTAVGAEAKPGIRATRLGAP